MKKLKIGILGTANIAKKSIIPTLLDLGDLYEILGVGGREISKTEAFCNEFGLKAFSSYEDLIRSADLDAVYIPLPNSMHFEWVMKALEAGLHVMCEKSLGCNQTEVEAMVKKAREKNLLLMEHFQFRFHNQLSFILETINQGTIGELRTIRSTFGIPPFSDNKNIRYFSDLGGGALLDNGAYPIKLAQILMSDSISLENCRLNKVKSEVDIWGNLSILDEKSGVSFQAAFGFDHIYRCDLEIIGSRGRIYTDRIYTAPPNYKPMITIEKQVGYNIEKENITINEDDHFKKLWSYFHKLISEQCSFELEYQHNLNQSALIDKALKLSHGK